MEQLGGYGMDFPGYVDIYPEIKLPIELFERQIAKKDAIANKLMQDAQALYDASVVEEGPYSKTLTEEANKRLEPLRNMATEFISSGNMSVKDLRNQLLQFRQTEINDPARIAERQALARHNEQWPQFYEGMRKFAQNKSGYVHGTGQDGQRLDAESFDILRAQAPYTGAYISPENDQIELIENVLKAVIPQEQRTNIANAGLEWVTDAQGNVKPYIRSEKSVRKWFTENLVRERLGNPETLQLARQSYLAAHPHYAEQFKGLTEQEKDSKFLEDTIKAARGRFFDWTETDESLRAGGGGRGGGGSGEEKSKTKPHTAVPIPVKRQATPITNLEGNVVTPKDITVQNLDKYGSAFQNVFKNVKASLINQAEKIGLVPVKDETGELVNFIVPDNVSGSLRVTFTNLADNLNAKLAAKEGELMGAWDNYAENVIAAGFDPNRSLEQQIMEEYNNQYVVDVAQAIPDLKKILKELSTTVTISPKTGVAVPSYNEDLHTQMLSGTVKNVFNMIGQKDPEALKKIKAAILENNPKAKYLETMIKGELEYTDMYMMNSFGFQDNKMKNDVLGSFITVIGNKQANTIRDLSTGKYLNQDEMEDLAKYVNKQSTGKTESEEEGYVSKAGDLGSTLRALIDPETGETIPSLSLTLGDRKYVITADNILNMDAAAIEEGLATNAELQALQSFHKEAIKNKFAFTRVREHFVDIANEGKQSGYRFYIPQTGQAYESTDQTTSTSVIMVLDGVDQLKSEGANAETINTFIKTNGFNAIIDPYRTGYLKQKSSMFEKRWANESLVNTIQKERAGQAKYTESSQDVKAILDSEWRPGGPDKAKGSTAYGPGQFVEGTWLGRTGTDGYLYKAMDRYTDEQKAKVRAAKTKEDKLALRGDIGIARKASAEMLTDIRDDILSNAGVDQVRPWMLKIGYMFPARVSDIIRAYKQSPGTRVSNFVTDKEFNANPEFFRGINTVGDLVTKAINLVGN